ncbi:hypothetical protein CHELA1G2_21968 [Hyphomicrobiales bacterium]|nr:hypothetical protein CHELA1G2_21968 [Hyphomicrobiales bacterium]
MICYRNGDQKQLRYGITSRNRIHRIIRMGPARAEHLTWRHLAWLSISQISI